MLPDISPVLNGDMTLLQWATRENITTAAQLRRITEASLDEIAAILGDADDAAVTFFPNDPLADDQYAPEHEQHQGWSAAHLVLHVTASAEEWAAVSSILARGIAYPKEPRLRYEPDWHTVTTRAQVDQRLAESRRMRLAFLDSWPDAPMLDVFRDLSDNFVNKFGKMNAVSAYLFGLRHEWMHLEQMREAMRQARETARENV
ncbi:MAG: DinB family protein [Chloroflexi bacterium]|nr:DinB family protein [Chloroflexota bacterium]